VAVAIDSLKRVRETHVADEISLPVHWPHRQAGAELGPALLHEDDLFLEEAGVHRCLQQARHEFGIGEDDWEDIGT